MPQIQSIKWKKELGKILSNECSDCKKTFDRIDVWPHPKNPKRFICRSCQRRRKLEKQKSFESEFRDFRKRQDYVPEEETFQAEQFRISDNEFDDIIREFEQAHWTDISYRESQTHHRYIESLFQREFWQRTHSKDRRNYQKEKQMFTESDIVLYYNLLGITVDSTDAEIKEVYRRLILKWHPDKNPNESKYAEKMLISIKIAFDKIRESRK